MEKPYFRNERAEMRIRKNGVAEILEIFTTLYHSHMYKYAFVWQCVITVDYNHVPCHLLST